MKSEGDPYYYRLPPFLGEFRQGRPVLVYHKLGFPRLNSERKGLWISPRLFSRQLAELKAAGFLSMELDSGAVTGDGVAITFDDGYASVLRHGLEPLRENGFSAVQFLVCGFLGKTNSWDRDAEPLMDKAQVRDWLQAGHSIGAHTVNHVRLTQVNEAVAREEIAASRKFLEDEFGVVVKHFCYPYGDWNQRVAEMVAEAGYTTASTTDYGINTAESDPFELKRIHAYVPLRSLPGLYYFLRR
ncbi:MAG: polysaccharide deacetylase family protein [Verrucomicrobiota bacterium]